MSSSLLTAAADRLLDVVTQYYESGEYVKPFSSKEVADCVVHHAAAAGIATLAPGVIPGLGAGVATVVSTGAIWAMYIRMSKMIGTSIKKETLKVIASAAISNIAMNAAVFLAFSLIPGVGAVAAGIIGFASVYAAGLIFLTTLTRLFKVRRTDVENLSDEEWKAQVKEAVSGINMKTVINEAKNIFMDMRKNGTLDEIGKDVDIDPEDDA